VEERAHTLIVGRNRVSSIVGTTDRRGSGQAVVLRRADP
jgi:hypothetical protein